jgi:hypothetical protein
MSHIRPVVLAVLLADRHIGVMRKIRRLTCSRIAKGLRAWRWSCIRHADQSQLSGAVAILVESAILWSAAPMLMSIGMMKFGEAYAMPSSRPLRARGCSAFAHAVLALIPKAISPSRELIVAGDQARLPLCCGGPVTGMAQLPVLPSSLPVRQSASTVVSR